MPVEDFIIYVYCCVHDSYRETVKTPLRSRGFEPKVTDCEVITMEIVGEFMGQDRDLGIWRYFKEHWKILFKNIGSRSSFVKQSANLTVQKHLIQCHLANALGALNSRVHLIDGFPMEVCKPTRVKRSRCFKGEAGFSYCAAKDQKYYGFEGHLMTSDEGVICGQTFAMASLDERDVIHDIVGNIQGLLIGDKGYIRPRLKEDMANQGIDLQTPLRKNMQDPRPKAYVKELMRKRRLVETVIGQLTERFHIEKVRARDTWHLSNRFIRKILAHTVGVFLNKLLGNKPLQFEALAVF